MVCIEFFEIAVIECEVSSGCPARYIPFSGKLKRINVSDTIYILSCIPQKLASPVLCRIAGQLVALTLRRKARPRMTMSAHYTYQGND